MSIKDNDKSSNPNSNDNSFDNLHESLEALRSKIIDLEAMAHAAVEIMDKVPYLPRQPRHQPAAKPEWTGEQRRNLGRMQSLVFATAAAAGLVLDEINELLDDTDQGGGSDEGGPGNRGGSPGEDSGGNGDSNAPSGPQGAPRGSGASGSDDTPHGQRGAPAVTGGQSRGSNDIPQRSGGIELDLDPTPPALL